MYNQISVLILEDDPDQLNAIAGVIENQGLRALPCDNPSKALRIMQRVPPVLAIIDRDMSRASDRQRSSLDVLTALDRQHPTCTVFVFSNAISTLAEQAQVWTSHKSAILHEKRFGLDTLLRRLRMFVTPRVGDLEIRDGAIRNRITGAVATHRVACSLMLAYPRAVTLPSGDQAKAARRFRDWLRDNSQCVELLSKGNRLYELHVDEARHRRILPEDAAEETANAAE